MAQKQWAGTTYGNSWMHKSLIVILRYIDIRILYLFASVGLSKMNDTHAETRSEEIIGILGLSAFFLAPHIFPNISQIAVGMITMIVAYVVLMLIDKYKQNKLNKQKRG